MEAEDRERLAFPGGQLPSGYTDEGRPWNDGMTLRDYFAAAAITGMLAYSRLNPASGNYHENCSLAEAASVAYGYADAMLEARKR